MQLCRKRQHSNY